MKTKLFIEKANLLHNNFYDYSKVDYKNNYTKIIIICPKHGEFSQTPNVHLDKKGCAQCGKEKQTNTVSEFIEKANKEHNNFYDYSMVDYKNNKTTIEIICPKHGKFNQRPYDHLNKKGCSQCGREKSTEKQTNTLSEFIDIANRIHLNFYDYSKSNYINNKTKIDIICHKHGKFRQRANDHIMGHGCAKCVNKNEFITGRLLKEIFKIVDLKSQKKVDEFRVDYFFEINNTKYVIEYNGKQHYEPVKFGNLTESQAEEMFERQIARDQRLREYCKENSIILIEIDGREYQGIKIKEFLQDKLKDVYVRL